MATDAVVTLLYSDCSHLVSFYKRTDAFHDDIIKMLRKAFDKYDNDTCFKEQHVEFHYLASYIINAFVQDRNDTYRGIKILPNAPREGDTSFCFRIYIIPVVEPYDNKKPGSKIEQCLMIQIMGSGVQKENYYTGLLSDYKE